MKTLLLAVTIFIGINSFAQSGTDAPVPSQQPSTAQKAQIQRKYGMFLHFGINTFVDKEWTDGKVNVSEYKPTAIDADQWVKTAKDAGMKFVILVTKHHDGFCLWDSKQTDYDVGSAENKTNVPEAVARACKKYGIGLAFYYSLWDRHQNPDVADPRLDEAYTKFVTAQLKELIGIAHGQDVPVVEFWMDGSWAKPNYRWNCEAIYKTIKDLDKDCQVGINWSIGLPGNIDKTVAPERQKEGFPIRYFPSDFRLGDPHLPANPDPKIFSHDGKSFYMPFESTVCLSKDWFYNTKDNKYKSVETLVRLYKKATAQDNLLVLDSPPDRNGRLREKDVKLLLELREKIRDL